MHVLFLLLFLASLLCLLAGLIRPTLVLRWGQKRTRGRALGWYALFAFLFLALGARTSTQPSGNIVNVNLPKEAESNLGTDGAKNIKKEYIQHYCNFMKEIRAMRRDLDCNFGIDHLHSRKPGETITLEDDLTGTITPQTQKQPGQGVVKFSAGTKIKIIKRHFYSEECSDTLYIVQGKGLSNNYNKETKGVVTGYVRPVSIQLKSDSRKALDFARQYNEEEDRRTATLKKKYAKMLPEDIENTAIAENWRNECPQRN